MADASREHWEGVYTTKGETAVSWYQPHADQSLQLIQKASPTSIVDIGGGASTLVDDLLSHGLGDISVLDISESALSRSKARLGEKAAKVDWIVADITQWKPQRRWDVWHDRAVFHFLTGDCEQAAYIVALEAGTAPAATVVMATFALDGPEKCSGLPVQRYSPQTLAARLGPRFTLIDSRQESHHTPWNAEQKFSYAVLRRTD